MTRTFTGSAIPWLYISTGVGVQPEARALSFVLQLEEPMKHLFGEQGCH